MGIFVETRINPAMFSIKPYNLKYFYLCFKVIRDYYGMSNSNIMDKMTLMELKPNYDPLVIIPIHIDFSTLEELVDRWHFDVEEGRQRDYICTFFGT